jgi:regulator of RNase E activity RraB
MKGTDFANFLNLQDTSEPVKVQKDENRRVCYLINVISKNLLDQSVSDEWVKTILERCNISYRYYRSHYSEPGGADATKADKAFAESIRNAVDFFTKYG